MKNNRKQRRIIQKSGMCLLSLLLGLSTLNAAPTNDDCENAIILSFGVITEGSLVGALSSTADNKADVYYRFTAQTDGVYTITFQNPNPRVGNFGNDINLSISSSCNSEEVLCAMYSDGAIETVQITHSGTPITYYCHVNFIMSQIICTFVFKKKNYDKIQSDIDPRRTRAVEKDS